MWFQLAKAPLLIASNQVSPVELFLNRMSSVPLPKKSPTPTAA